MLDCGKFHSTLANEAALRLLNRYFRLYLLNSGHMHCARQSQAYGKFREVQLAGGRAEMKINLRW
jgi:hypothetical protein